MLPKGIPGQLVNQPMILVQIGAAVGKDKIRREGLFELLKICLDFRALIREITVAKIRNSDHRAPGGRQPGTHAGLGLSGPRAGAAEDDPGELSIWIPVQQREDRPPATDLNVVAVGS